MKEINVREMRASIGRLAELVEAEGELVISRRGQPIARLQTTSAELLRAERDAH
jgi:antitoxin (DNA-binding transcriptional repressor) of toxin-antitoxin stability system